MSKRAVFIIEKILKGEVKSSKPLKFKNGVPIPYYKVMDMRDDMEKKCRESGDCYSKYVIQRTEEEYE
jgi:hypothetical protein